METTAERLLAQLPREALRPAYLIAGSEALRVLEAADAVRAQARASGCDEREVFDADARDFDWNMVAASFGNFGLFSSHRLVEIRLPTGKPGKDGAAVINGFCADPPDGVTLLVVAGDWSRSHAGKWSEAIAAAGHVAIAWPVKPHELVDWVERRLRAKGVRADRDAVAQLAARVEGNLLAAAQEVDKLCLLLGTTGTTLNAEQIRALVADLARFDVFRLLEAAWNGQGAQTLRMLEGLRQEGEVIPALMGMVIIELKITAALSAAAGSGSLDRAFSERRVWPAKQAMYRRALERHGYRRWQRFLVEAGKVDRASKGREVGDAWVHLQRLLVAIAAPGGIGLLRSEIAAA